MKNKLQTILGILSFVAIIVGLAYDTKVNTEIAHASYNVTADTLFSTVGTNSQYLRGDETWQTLNPAAMGVPSGTSGQYYDGTLSLRTFPALYSSPYSSYQAIVAQTGTGAPTGTSLNNNFGSTTFTWARTSAGVYTLTASAPTFTSGKTTIVSSQPSNPLAAFQYVITSTTVITLTTTLTGILSLALTTPATDALLNNILVEVRVYP